MRSPLSGWLGGKYRLATKIIKLIPDHLCYVEPFAGAAWVLFKKPASKVEVLNDWNGDVVNLYRVLQNHLEEFLRFFKWVLVSREEFERLLKLQPDALTDIQRAARFYYVQKLSFAGEVVRPSFGTSVACPRRLNLLRIEEELSSVHLRLARATLERLPYQEVLSRYDRPTTFFYLDPPYWGFEDYYGKGMFCRNDFTAMAQLLAGIKGKFLLSLNDLPEVRDVFRSFHISPVSTRYSAGKNNKSVVELFVRNY